MHSAMLVALAFLQLQSAGENYEIRIEARFDDASIEGAEACWYQYTLHDPFSAFRSSPYECAPADDVVKLPARKDIALFVRHSTGLISSNPLIVAPEQVEMRSFHFELEKGAQLDLRGVLKSLEPNERLVLIFGGGESSRAFAIPVSEPVTLVPAKVPVVPVTVQHDRVIAIGDTLNPQPGEILDVPSFRDGGGVILRIAPEDPIRGSMPAPANQSQAQPYAPDALALLIKQTIPSIELVDVNGKRFQPDLGPTRTDDLTSALYVFSAAPEGSMDLVISGGRWQRTRSRFEINSGVTVEESPFPARLGGTLTLTESDLLEWLMSFEPSPCRPSAETPEFLLALHRCPANSAVGCVDEQASEISAGSTPVEGLAPGRYRILGTLGDQIVTDSLVTLTAGADQTVLIEPSGFVVTGRVTADDQPLAGTVGFRTGETMTSSNGEFIVSLESDPGISPIRFMSCDELVYYQHKPAAGLVSGGFVHVEIPMHAIIARIEDARTGTVIEDATANVAILIDEKDPNSVDYFAVAIDEDGEKVARHIEQGKAYRLCAEHPGYESACGETRIKKRGSETVTVELKPVQRRAGRVLGNGYNSVYWFFPDGRVSESARIAPDGTFHYVHHHGPEELVVLVGTAPLYVTSAPPAEGTLEIPIEARPARTVIARVEQEGRTALVALWIDGLRIPNQALAEHQMIRRERMFIMNGAPAIYRDITGSTLAFAAGPDPNLLPPGSDISDPRLFIGIQPRTASGDEIVLDRAPGSDSRRQLAAGSI